TSRSSSPSIKPSGARPGPRAQGSGARPPVKKPGKSIVNQRQTPWGLIIAAVLVVVFAVAIIGYAVTRKGSGGPSYLHELADAKAINAVTFSKESERGHVTGKVKYDATPPVGGRHSGYNADCTGTVYPNAIANENAVHSLEHGAVWITYQPDLAKAEVDALAKNVNGVDRMMMSPYPGLKSKISFQSWGYQLFLDSASDPRIQQFIDAVRYNPKTTPEYGASCAQPTFKNKPSTFGNPLAGPS
ncbi:MAG: DUF3105 domain-containing protein, partial [Actinomycetota bacterium]